YLRYYVLLSYHSYCFYFFFFQAEDGIRDKLVTGVQTCALPICHQQAADRHAGVDGEDSGPRQRPDAEDHGAGEGDVRADQGGGRSEERRVGKECRSRWSQYH